MLLHSPPLAAAWLDFNNAVRYETELDDRTRELIILRVAVLTGCGYVLKIHAGRYAEPAGVTQKEVEALSARDISTLLAPRERALLAYVDAMTRDVEVPDGIFAALREHFDERRIVELTVLIGSYNMHTRVLRALGIEPE
ncbi:MAG: carboxymuconolactone decarboxylase family protein [Betaproteobacteria bacterium]|nr:carboxymuconolactone decarboxylase family protein [Betaproteobacteria bacterium]